MASRQAVAGALAILQEVFPREITDALVKIYQAALKDVDDDALKRATGLAVKQNKFFPVPAELRDLAGVNRAPFVDTDALLDRIRGMGSYTATSGERPPRVDAVRLACGPQVAEAYSIAGPDRLFSGNETTRAIARKDFTREYSDLLRIHGEGALPLPALPAKAFESLVIDGARPALAGPQHIAGLLARGTT